MQYTKSQFIAEFAAHNGMTGATAEKHVNSFINFLYAQLRAGHSVNISGFGKFSVHTRASRTGVNPRTGERIVIPKFNAPKFKAGESFKSAVKLRK